MIDSRMGAANHDIQTGKELHDFIIKKGIKPRRVLLPAYGETYWL